MEPLVDEAALLVVLIFTRPCAEQVVIERRTAGGAAVGRCPVQFLHHLRNGSELLFEDQPADIVMGEAGAFAHRLRAGLHFRAQSQRQQAFHQPGATAAAG